jgi:peptidoglycan/LPS O-acetylase OafA/YrhL
MSNKDTENNFDLIRLFAASEVAFKHVLLEHLPARDEQLWVLSVFPGVPIFFLISGFLIFKSFYHSGSIRKFAINRVLRVYPALIVCFVVSVGLVLLSGYMKIGMLATSEFWIWAAAQLSFVQIYNAPFLRGFGVGSLNGSLWTIGVELQFYVLTPILFYLTQDRKWMWPLLFFVFAGANLLMRYWGETEFLPRLYSLNSPPWFFMFILGAWIFTRPDWLERIKQLNLGLLVAGYLAMTAAGWWLGFRVTGNWINPVSYTVLAIIVIKLAYTKPWLSGRLLKQNDISYGIYIYHMPISNLLLFYGLLGSVWYALLAMALAVCFAAASWWLAERPVLAMKPTTLRRY